MSGLIADPDRVYPIDKLCAAHGVSRQAYYQHHQAEVVRHYEEAIVLQWVQRIRCRQPRIGARKLLYLLTPDLEKAGFQLGRDCFFDLLRKNDMLVKRRKKYHRTTDSSHHFRRYSNLIQGLDVTRCDHVFVADITYVDTREGFLYLALLTDIASRKIVGYDISESLAVEGSLRALNTGLSDVDDPTALIHHSDRGIQYCCHAYTGRLNAAGARISMGEKGNPYENALAERVNGILKDEFLLDQTFPTQAMGKEAAHESVYIYNNERPHSSIGLLMPAKKYERKRSGEPKATP